MVKISGDYTGTPKQLWQKYHQLFIVILLLLLTWGSRFYYCSEFGLYSDDQYRIPLAMDWTWSEFFQYIGAVPFVLINFEAQGRALHPTLIMSLSFLGEQMGGLQAIYWIGYTIVATNTLLFYFLLKRLTNQPFFTVAAALAFALFPADTTQAFLTHALGVQPALTLLLLAFHLYITGRKVSQGVAYLLNFITLFCYERFFLVFIAAPLLRRQRWDKRLVWELLRHGLILAVMLGGVAIARRLGGEARVSERLREGTLFKMLADMVIGPFVGLSTFISQPIAALGELRLSWLVPLLLAFFAVAFVLRQLPILDRSGHPLQFQSLRLNQEVFQLERRFFFQDIGHWAIVGMVMLVMAYPLTLIGDVTSVSGRGSRVHVAAVIGAAILVACITSMLVFVASTYRKRPLVNWGLAVLFTLLLAFGFTVQKDYRNSWRYQQAMWTDIVRLSPDMTRGTFILIEIDDLKEGKEVATQGYSSRLLDTIYRFPPEWGGVRVTKPKFLSNPDHPTHQPVVYELKQGWYRRITSDPANENILVLDKRKGVPKVDSNNIILLENQNGRFVRRTSLTVEGKIFPLKQNDMNLKVVPFDKGVLYPHLVTDRVDRVRYLKD